MRKNYLEAMRERLSGSIDALVSPKVLLTIGGIAAAASIAVATANGYIKSTRDALNSSDKQASSSAAGINLAYTNAGSEALLSSLGINASAAKQDDSTANLGSNPITASSGADVTRAALAETSIAGLSAPNIYIPKVTLASSAEYQELQQSLANTTGIVGKIIIIAIGDINYPYDVASADFGYATNGTRNFDGNLDLIAVSKPIGINFALQTDDKTKLLARNFINCTNANQSLRGIVYRTGAGYSPTSLVFSAEGLPVSNGWAAASFSSVNPSYANMTDLWKINSSQKHIPTNTQAVIAAPAPVIEQLAKSGDMQAMFNFYNIFTNLQVRSTDNLLKGTPTNVVANLLLKAQDSGIFTNKIPVISVNGTNAFYSVVAYKP